MLTAVKKHHRTVPVTNFELEDLDTMDLGRAVKLARTVLHSRSLRPLLDETAINDLTSRFVGFQLDGLRYAWYVERDLSMAGAARSPR
jgi:hypothetical protein